MESQQQVMIDGNLRIAEATRRALEGIRTESPTYAEMTIDSVVVMIDKLGRWMANAMAQEETPDEMAARNGNAHGEGVYIKGRPVGPRRRQG